MLGDDKFGAHAANMDRAYRARQMQDQMRYNLMGTGANFGPGHDSRWDALFQGLQDAGADKVGDQSYGEAKGMWGPTMLQQPNIATGMDNKMAFQSPYADTSGATIQAGQDKFGTDKYNKALEGLRRYTQWGMGQERRGF